MAARLLLDTNVIPDQDLNKLHTQIASTGS